MSTLIEDLKGRITEASLERLRRIQVLRNCTPAEALSYAISCGWLAAEKRKLEKL